MSGGRVVLVVGGTRGIGLAIAEAFAKAGDHVAVTHRSEPVDGFLSVPCDVTDADQVDAAFAAVEAELGPPEVVVCNAGITRDQLIMRMKDDDFAAVVDTNLAGAWRVAKRASRGMLKARAGRLIFISSVVGLSGQAGQTNYAAAKAGLVGLARSLARELGSRGVTANVVAPGPVDTDMLAELDEATREQIVGQVPLGRIAEASEIAAAVTFLASPDAGFITGAVLPVDSGLGMGH